MMQLTLITPKKIRELIENAGFNQASIARDLEVSESLVSRVIDGTNVSNRVRDHIAICINKPVDTIWKPSNRRPGRPKRTGFYSTAA